MRAPIFLFLIFSLASYHVGAQTRFLKSPEFEKITPYTLFFDPLKNKTQLEKQQVEYDLSLENTLRVGPFVLSGQDIALSLTKEQGEYYEVEFGLEVRRRLGAMYVVSFRWPREFVSHGFIEVQNDKGTVLWRRSVSESDIESWKKQVQEQQKKIKLTQKKLQELSQGHKENKIDILRPETLSPSHGRSDFGFAYKGFFEFPIVQAQEPFRFCVSRDDGAGRLALCSRRYILKREFGQYALHRVTTEVRPRVLVNDRPVTLKGTAVFLDRQTPMKFSAILKDGTYYEFVSHPKEIRLVDALYDEELKQFEILGYGDVPIGDTQKDIYSDNIMWSFLNFMPTIGDKRRYWRAFVPEDQPYFYLKGEGGFPFRQRFIFKEVPPKRSRLELSPTSVKSTYKSMPILRGRVHPDFNVSAQDERARKIKIDEFEWNFNAKNAGQLNQDEIYVIDGEKKYVANYQIYRGYSAELSTRLTGLVSNELDFVMLGEVAGQYWFENIFGWKQYTLSQLRWGLAVKYFDTLFVATPGDSGFDSISVMNVDLKYRLDPGIWARDPTVGLILATQKINFDFKSSGRLIPAEATQFGGGVFWARSMPRFFDDFFNYIPFFRYPKWLDIEAILYPLSTNPEHKNIYSLAVNFHGKVQWTPRFFGEVGFGLKNFAWQDPDLGSINPGTNKPTGKSIGLGLGYATLGVGFNF